MRLVSLVIPSLICKAAFLMLLGLIMQHLTAATALTVASSLGNETDRVALLAIKSQLVDRPGGILSSWNESFNHCLWEGVTCGSKHPRVIALDLNSSGLVGTISPYIGNLSFLRVILLHNNSLSGQMRPEFGLLSRLETLSLENNTLVGEIPAALSSCKNLQILYLKSNKLKGNLPIELRDLVQLRRLHLDYNNFTGPLFDVLANITSLERISAAYNSFTGSIPDSISRMQNLTHLFLGMNKLSGILPVSLFKISTLQRLQVLGNQLSGSLPTDIGLSLPHLVQLDVGNNHLSGSIPISILNLTSLETLNLGENSFTGRVPRDIGNHLQNLQFLSVNDNQLIGDINFIVSLVNCSNLVILDVRSNEFTGTLSKSVANLSPTLQVLAISNNPITGSIPAGITNLINLVFVVMNNNQLTGSIPKDIGKLQNLQWVDFTNNSLTGSIPNSFGSLSQMTKLLLPGNKLRGNIPPSLGNCQNLMELYLSNNELNGTLVKELFNGSAKFVELVLSKNHLEGPLPSEISQQTNLVTFDVSENELSGEIPSSLSKCSGLQLLSMQENNFQGSIPPALSSLSSLQILDLSQNSLSGPIPEYLSKFPLLNLNLSYNRFEGVVPTNGVFTNTSAVSLAGNSGLCGGIPALHLTRCTEEHDKRRSLSPALKLAISIISALVGIVIIATSLYIAYNRRRKSDSLDTPTLGGLIQVSYSMLLKATDDFSASNLLGAGNFGSVFKGMLDGKTVAVKVLNLRNRGASKSFLAECNALSNIRHRNLLGIITACSSIDFQQNDFKALVYEFMSNGSLDTWLHEAGKLTLLQRVNVAIDVAHALNYLHHDCEIPLVHCDLKPSNILLDEDMIAHVGDFGLAKFLAQPQHPNQSSSIGIRGTVGYAAPEYGLGDEASRDGDLYSYGILLLELMTGKRPTDNMFKEDLNLHMYAEAALPEQVLQIVDPTLEDDEITEAVEDITEIEDTYQRKVDCIFSMVRIGVACSNQVPQDRMKITEALNKLLAARDSIHDARQRPNIPRGTPSPLSRS